MITKTAAFDNREKKNVSNYRKYLYLAMFFDTIYGMRKG